MTTKRASFFLFAIAALAFGVRVVFIAMHPPVGAEILMPLADSTDYDHLARALLRGDGFVNTLGNATAFRPPVYPLFLAMVYAVAGAGNFFAVAFVQALLATGATLLCGLLARRAGAVDSGVLAAALLYALYPAFIVQIPQVLSEELGRVLLLAMACAMMDFFAVGSPRALAAGALLLAIAVLNKSVLAITIPFIGLLVLFQKKNVPVVERLLAGCIFAAPICILIGGWTIRNAMVSGAFIPVSTNFPITFSHGVTKWSYHTNEWYGSTVELMRVPDNFRDLTQLRGYRDIAEELSIGSLWKGRAMVWVAEHKRLFVKLSVWKGLHFWGPIIRGSLATRVVALLSMGFVIGGGWLQIVRRGFRGSPAMKAFCWLALCIAVPVTLPYAISQGDVRYRLSLVDPLWMVLCGALLADLMGAMRSKFHSAG